MLRLFSKLSEENRSGKRLTIVCWVKNCNYKSHYNRAILLIRSIRCKMLENFPHFNFPFCFSLRNFYCRLCVMRLEQMMHFNLRVAATRYQLKQLSTYGEKLCCEVIKNCANVVCCFIFISMLTKLWRRWWSWGCVRPVKDAWEGSTKMAKKKT